MSGPPLVELRGVSKSFGGVRAVDDMQLTLAAGEVLGLLGHNGAGKSTLIRMLSGASPPDSGVILLDGEPVRIASPRDARRLGIETIYQDLALADNLDAPANLFLGRELRNAFGLLDERAMERAARDTLAKLTAGSIDLRTPVGRLSGGQRQAIAIARALHFEARVLIMDEPTASLGPEETQRVAALIEHLALGEGLGIILVSHDIHDVFELADRVTVMKAGRLVGSRATAELAHDELLEMIIAGRPREAGTAPEGVDPKPSR